jgi:hypothetical protein
MLKTGTSTLLALTVVALAATSHHAQAQAKTVVQTTPAVAARPEPAAQPVNILLDLTITDQTGTADSLKKTLSMIVADRGSGSIRSLGNIRNQGQVQINMDARPQILSNGSVRVALGLEYNPRRVGSESPSEWSRLNQQIGVVLQPGKPLVISQAADPASDRRIQVEMTATISK